MATAPDKTKVEAYPADRDRLNELAGQLTDEGPGRFGQAETLRWLLDWREQAVSMIMGEDGVEHIQERRMPRTRILDCREQAAP